MLHRKLRYSLLTLGIVSAFISTAALAITAIPPTPFTVTPTAIPGVAAGFSPFTATFKEFGYSAVVRQNEAGFFTETGVLNIGTFRHPDTLTTIASATSGLGAVDGYSLYESFSGSGFATNGPGGVVNVTFTSFSMTLFGHAGPGFNATLDGAGNPVIPLGSVVLGNSTSFIEGEAHVFSGLANGDFDILGTFLPVGGFLSGTVFTGSPLGAFYDLNGVTSLICPGIVTCTAPIAVPIPPVGTAFIATLTGSGNQSFAPIPEPASVLLLGSGLAGLGLYSFRRRKVNQI